MAYIAGFIIGFIMLAKSLYDYKKYLDTNDKLYLAWFVVYGTGSLFFTGLAFFQAGLLKLAL